MPQAQFEAAYADLMAARDYGTAHAFLCSRTGLDPAMTYSRARLLAERRGLASR